MQPGGRGGGGCDDLPMIARWRLGSDRSRLSSSRGRLDRAAYRQVDEFDTAATWEHPVSGLAPPQLVAGQGAV